MFELHNDHLLVCFPCIQYNYSSYSVILTCFISFTARDCLFLGKHSFNNGYYGQSIEWFEEALSRAHREGNFTAPVDEITPFYNMALTIVSPFIILPKFHRNFKQIIIVLRVKEDHKNNQASRNAINGTEIQMQVLCTSCRI